MSNINRSIQYARVLGRVYGRLPEAKRRHLQFAFDEAEKTDYGDVASKVVGYLTPRLSRDELKAVVDALKEVIGDPAKDEPPVSSQSHTTEREAQAMDARLRSKDTRYAAMFPDAAKIGVDDGYGKQSSPKAISAKSSTVADYEKLFFGAASTETEW